MVVYSCCCDRFAVVLLVVVCSYCVASWCRVCGVVFVLRSCAVVVVGCLWCHGRGPVFVSLWWCARVVLVVVYVIYLSKIIPRPYFKYLFVFLRYLKKKGIIIQLNVELKKFVDLWLVYHV